MHKRGAALVEFAMVMPILMMFFYGMIELSRVLLLQHTVDTASYEGARSAIVPGATSQDAVDCASKLLATSKLKSAKITVEPTVITEDTPVITVLVEVPIRENAWMTPFWFKKGSVKSEVTLITERPPIIQLTGVPQLKAKSKKAKTTSAL
jgi:Flp pilus assembly protein TadG